MASPKGYSRVQIGLHWVIALLILFQLLFHDGMEAAWEAFQKGMPIEGNSAQIHASVGALVLVLAVIRIIIRLRRGAPDLPPDGNPLQDLAAKATHIALYALLVLVPLSGMAAWGGGIVPAAGVHGLLFTGLFFLVLLHLVAALYHQYYLKDGLIRRMMRSE